ncbi:MAG: hypothetical protein HWE27_19385 [Gammaproteobacteria bacterium]|nr:hypothetical protein [Gammaproteobacteria bacterium]
MLKKLGMSVATGALIFTLLQPQEAQANAATDLGMKLAEKVAGLLIGEAFSSIFGGENPAATPQEVQNIVNAGFNQAALNEIEVDLGTVMSSINKYNYTLSYKFNGQTIGDIIEQTGKVQTQVGVHMNHNNFMTLAKTYMSASTVQLAFLSERRRYVQLEAEEKIESINDDNDLTAQQKADKITDVKADLATQIQGENNTIAGAALESVTGLANFFYEDFYEKGPGSQGCIYKYPETPWVAPNFVAANNKDFAMNDRPTVTCRNYGPMLKMTSTVGAPFIPVDIFGTTPWQSTDVMATHKDDLWAFSIKKWSSNPGPHDNDYHMLVIKGEDLSRYVRNLNSITKYQESLGDVEGMVLSWIDIVIAHGDVNQSASALMKATKLGIEHSKLVNRYKAKHAELVYHFNVWFEGKLNKWGLSSQNAPTRIEFNPKEYYPTNAPVWLEDAMN